MLNLNFPIFITLLVLVPVLGYNDNSTYLPDNSTNCNSSFITEKITDSYKISHAIDTLFFFIMFNIFGWKYLFIDFIIS